MPELPEVERARKLIDTVCKGFKIAAVEATEDKLVFADGISQADLARELEGRTIEGCSRKGKIFWMDLSGDGQVPVMHFGMNGMLMLKGREPDWYIRRPKRSHEHQWPPKYLKFLLKLEPQDGSVSDEPLELAFVDSRRFARVRLVPSPAEAHPPISALGFDPVLSLPPLDEFTSLLRARPRSTVKGVIMDQAFSAGVGNWVADEVLFQARLHPACPVAALSHEDVGRLYEQISEVPRIAVDVDANHSKFPKHWLFTWRWSKGKKDKNRKLKTDGNGGMQLVDGRPATISFITVGGRTSAFVEEVQKLPKGVEIKEKVSRKKAKSEDGSSASDAASSSALSEEEAESTSRRRGGKVKVEPVEVAVDEPDAKPKRSSRRKSAVKLEEDEAKPAIKAAATPPSKRARKGPPLLPSLPTASDAKQPQPKRKRQRTFTRPAQPQPKRQPSSELSDVPDA